MRRYGQSVKPDVQYRHRPGAYGIIMRSGQVLLTQENLTDVEIQLPGGGIDAGETALQALHRECLEETGWKVQIDRRLGAYQRFTFMSDYGFWAQKICHIYICRPVYKLHDPIEPFHKTIWADANDAVNLLTNEGDRDFLAAVLNSY
jgi:8-oxo-dGTP diphosphatase